MAGRVGAAAYADVPADHEEPTASATPDSPPILPPAKPYGSPPPSEPSRSARLAPMLAVLALAVVVVLAGLLWLGGNDGEQPVADGPTKPAQTPTADGPQEPPQQRRPTQSPDASANDGQQRPRTQKSEKSDRPDHSQNRGTAFTPAAMEQSVSDYYAIMPSDTRTGFKLLGPSLRSDGFRSYDDFWDTVDSVDVRGLQADPSSHTVDATVVFVSKDGSTSTEQHRFGLVKDPSGDGLLINTDDLLG